MAAVMPAMFSENGKYFAYTSSDGTLKVWETRENVLKHEYTPSSHLSSTCTCLCWGSIPFYQRDKNKKKRKASSEDNTERSLSIALGTSSGDILIYNLSKGDLHTRLTDGHNGAVNSLCWSSEGEFIYSCSEDQHIVEWDVKSSKVKHKWRGDKTSLHCVALHNTQRHLVTAGRSIKVWCLETRRLVQSFIGHATEVFSLLPVTVGRSLQNGDAAHAHALDGTYLFSAAVMDRAISAWQFSSSAKSDTALATFAMPSEPVHLDSRAPASSDQTCLLSVTSQSGDLAIFEHRLNGRCKEPLEPAVRVQVATSRDKKRRRIPVLASHVTSGKQRHIHIAHGNLLKPTFEKILYKSLEPETLLIREESSLKKGVQLETAVSKVKTPVTSGEVTVLGPGHMAETTPSAPSAADSGPHKKDKRKRQQSIDMSLEDRLNAISMEKPSQGAGKALPKTDTMATLLAQGLRSNDVKMLDSVLNRGDVRLIRHSVKNLPLPLIVPLVHELTARINRHSQTARTCLKWVRVVLTSHTSYLMSFPELVDSLSALYQLMESRCQTFSKLARLQGKLDLMLSQITTQEEGEGEGDAQHPLLVYQDESSDDDIGMADIMNLQSESEDNWEELSDGDMDAEDDVKPQENHVTPSSSKKRPHNDTDANSDNSDSDSSSSEGAGQNGDMDSDAGE